MVRSKTSISDKIINRGFHKYSMILKNRLSLLILLSIINIIILVGVDGNKNLFTKVVYNSTNFIRIVLADTVAITQKAKDIFVSNSKLRNENKRLEKEINEYRKQLKSIDAVLFENKKLRTLLQFKYSIDYDIIPANIISAGLSEGSRNFIVNRGIRDGISNDMIVCGIYQNRLVLLGRIIAVSPRSSTFQSISETNFSMPVITSVSNQTGFLIGQGVLDGNLRLIFDSLYLTKNVFVGEEVYIYEHSRSFPRGIPIGSIAHIVTNKDDLLVSASVTPFISPDKVDVVLVLLSKKDKE